MFKIKPLIITISLTLAMAASAQDGLSELEKKVISDYKSMESKTADQRRDFRKQIFGNPDKKIQRPYNQAYKRMMEAGLMPKLSDVGKASILPKNTTLRIPGTSITYDNGLPTGTFVGQSSFMLGNLFNTDEGQAVEPSGSVTMVTFDMQAVGGGNVFLSMYSNIMGASANQVTSMGTPAVPGLNTITLPTALSYSNGAFLAGIWQFTAGSDTLAASTGSINGQGFHGVSINDGGVGMSYNSMATSGGMGVNAIFRVQGDVTTPVELMNFDIE